MAEELPKAVPADRARFLLLTDSAKADWTEVLREILKNPNPFAVKVVAAVATAADVVDDALKAAGPIDEVIVLMGASDKGMAADAVARAVERAAFRVEMYQPEGRAAARVTVCAPANGGEALAREYRGVALLVGGRYVDLKSATTDQAVAEAIARVFAAGNPPEPPAKVTVEKQHVTWTASATKDVIGYEVHDLDDAATLLTTATGTEATLPEGHDACEVRARDGAGRVSVGVKAGE